MRGAIAGPGLVLAGALLACAGSARAATLTLDAVDGCVVPTTLEQEVADLLGRPLSEVPEADFRLTIARQPNGRWHSRLEEIEHRPGLPDAIHLRELDAMSCPALGDAAAVAMGVAIRALESPPGGHATLAPAGPASPPEIARAAPPPVRSPSPWRPVLTIAAAADSGDLPATGLGIMAGGALRHRSLRLAVAAGWFPARDMVLTGGIGGRFQLAFAAADACFAPAWGAWTVLGCAGGELGAYRATGLGVTSPESRTAFWRAGRASLGAALGLNSSVALLAQATAIVPWPRPEFVLDGTIRVYRSDALVVRITVGLDLMF